MHRIAGTRDPRNGASARVLQKIGMSYEGRMRHTPEQPEKDEPGWSPTLRHQHGEPARAVAADPAVQAGPADLHRRPESDLTTWQRERSSRWHQQVASSRTSSFETRSPNRHGRIPAAGGGNTTPRDTSIAALACRQHHAVKCRPAYDAVLKMLSGERERYRQAISSGRLNWSGLVRRDAASVAASGLE